LCVEEGQDGVSAYHIPRWFLSKSMRRRSCRFFLHWCPCCL